MVIASLQCGGDFVSISECADMEEFLTEKPYCN